MCQHYKNEPEKLQNEPEKLKQNKKIKNFPERIEFHIYSSQQPIFTTCTHEFHDQFDQSEKLQQEQTDRNIPNTYINSRMQHLMTFIFHESEEQEQDKKNENIPEIHLHCPEQPVLAFCSDRKFFRSNEGDNIRLSLCHRCNRIRCDPAPEQSWKSNLRRFISFFDFFKFS